MNQLLHVVPETPAKLAILLSIGLFLLCLNKLAIAENSRIPVIQIKAEGLSPLQIGLELGRKSKHIFVDIEQRYDAHLDNTVTLAQFTAIKNQHLPLLLNNVESFYQEELRGVVANWDITADSIPGDGRLSLQEFQILNLLPDLGFAPDGSALGVFGKASAEKKTIIGRNLDWNSSPELRSLQAITVFQYADSTVANIGFAGLTSVLTGFNDHGLFLALFNATAYSPYAAINPLRENSGSSAYDLRTSLMKSATVPSAIRHLRHRHYGFDNNILIADSRTVQLMEFSTIQKPQLRQWTSPLRPTRSRTSAQQIAVVDCHMSPILPDNCKDAYDIIRWQRLSSLANFNETQPATVATLSAIMLDTANQGFELFNRRTMQSMVFSSASNRLYLYAAQTQQKHEESLRLTPYLNLLAQTQHKATEENKNNSLNWLIWLLLLVLLSIVIWAFWHTRKTS